MSQPTSTQLLDHAIWTELGSRNDAEAEAFYDALSTLLSRWLLARSEYPEMEAIKLFAKVRALPVRAEAARTHPAWASQGRAAPCTGEGYLLRAARTNQRPRIA